MVKSAIRVLLAASALVPGIASAQQVEARGDAQVEAQRGGDHTQREQYRAERDQYRAQRQQGQQATRPNGQYQAQAQGGAQFRQGQGQPMRAAQGDDRARYQGQRPDYANGAYGQGGYAGRGDQPGRGANAPYAQGGYAGRGNQPQPNRWAPNAPGGQGGYAGRGGGYENRGGYDNRGGYQQARGGWNNGWRGDQRYDWNRYRYENRDAFHLPRYYAPANWGYGYRRFSVGVTLGYGFYGENYWIDDPYDYRLPPAYGPYRWVRYYNDALLVDVRSGYVVDAVYGIFW